MSTMLSDVLKYNWNYIRNLKGYQDLQLAYLQRTYDFKRIQKAFGKHRRILQIQDILPRLPTSILKKEYALDDLDYIFRNKADFVYSTDDVDQIKLYRIMVEAVDVAFLLANKFTIFTPGMLLNYILQDISTAMVLGTGYWPFYEVTKQSLCVCKYYNKECLHAYMCNQYIDMDMCSQNTVSGIVASTETTMTSPKNVKITFRKSSNGIEMSVSIKMDVVQINENGTEHCAHLRFYIAMDVIEEVKRPLVSIKIQPHPRSFYYYGRYSKYHVADDPIPDCIDVDFANRPKFTLEPAIAWVSIVDDSPQTKERRWLWDKTYKHGPVYHG